VSRAPQSEKDRPGTPAAATAPRTSRLARRLAKLRLPQHVAIIMDGNGRWARRRGLPRIEGHRRGAESVRRVIEVCAEARIRYLTLYAFSTENWKRPPEEIRELMQLLKRFLEQHRPDLDRYQVRLNVIGQLERLPEDVRDILSTLCRETRDHDKGVLTLALSYGSRTEITEAVRTIASKVAEGRLRVEDITEQTVAAHLYTADLPDPDLIIRTSGELRLSNFLLWQASYAELWVTPTLWPDFGEREFIQALEDYSRRQRRFGGVEDA